MVVSGWFFYSQFVSGVLIWSCLQVCSKIKTSFKTGNFWVLLRCLEDIVLFHKIELSSHLRGRLEKLAKNGEKSLRLSWWSRQPRVMQTAWKKKRIRTHFFTCLYQVNHLSWRQGFKTPDTNWLLDGKTETSFRDSWTMLILRFHFQIFRRFNAILGIS